VFGGRGSAESEDLLRRSSVLFDVLLFVEHKNKKSQERSADSKTIQKLLLWFWPELPFAARMEDDVSFVTLGALFGTARLRSRSVQDL